MVNKKSEVVFACTSCGHNQKKWLSKCPTCNEWNTLVQEVVSANILKI